VTVSDGIFVHVSMLYAVTWGEDVASAPERTCFFFVYPKIMVTLGVSITSHTRIKREKVAHIEQ